MSSNAGRLLIAVAGAAKIRNEINLLPSQIKSRLNEIFSSAVPGRRLLPYFSCASSSGGKSEPPGAGHGTLQDHLRQNHLLSAAQKRTRDFWETRALRSGLENRGKRGN